ncbi:MAG: DUF1793 domain-containing protein [Thermoflavifilum aggregans]|nr:DUF1793 domain-containing protein [Thermoflavifilum aggregans]
MHLAHNANLSIKAILGIACYGYLSNLIGLKDSAKIYLKVARDLSQKWIKIDWDEDHYSLTFDKKGTWSQKYNLVWDKLLDLNIFPDTVFETEIKYYLNRQNRYGIPLDSRKSYTKSDWIMWTATLTNNQNDFMQLIDPVYKYITETQSRVPVSDWHDTITGKQVGFQARSVVGGYFMQILYYLWHNKPIK